MTKDFIANLLVNQSKKTMIESIDNTDDIDFLKQELKKQLRENWNRQEEKDNLIKYLEDKINEVKIGGCSCETTNSFEIERKAYQDF